MKTCIVAGAMAGALIAGGPAAATSFADTVNVLVPGQSQITFTSFNEAASEFFTGVSALPASFVSGTVVLTEPDGSTSDTLSLIANGSGGVDVFFFSDPSVALPSQLSPRVLTLAETGKLQDVSSFFGPNISVQLGSDIDIPLPEPATWSLMLLGVAGLGFSVRRRAAPIAA